MAIQPNSYKGFRWTRGDATGGQLAILVPDTYRVLHFASAADEAADWNVANPTNPMFYVHSETTPATDYISFDHDATDGTLNVAGGDLKLAIAGTDVITVASTGLTSTGAVTSSGATSGVGYATGAGGTVTQATSKATGVTLNTATGIITMNAAALAADVTVAFTLTNSAIAATDAVVIVHESGGTLGAYSFAATGAAGSAVISVHNLTPAALSEAVVLRFVVIKSVNA